MQDVKQDACSLQTASLPEADLRRHPRFRIVDGGVLRLSVRPEFRGRLALLMNVSAGGIGVLLEYPLEAGTVLAFELQGFEGMESATRVARVRHSRPHPIPADAPWLAPTSALGRFCRRLFRLRTPQPKPHAWLVGCELDRPLSEGEVKQLVGHLRSCFAEPEE